MAKKCRSYDKAAVAAAALVFALSLCGCRSPEKQKDSTMVTAVQQFLDEYSEKYVELVKEANEAEWILNTRIVEGDDTNQKRFEEAKGKLAEFTGAVGLIDVAEAFLENRSQLEVIQVRQLERILYLAANHPQTVPDLVKARIAAEAKQTEALFGFEFQLGGQAVTANDLDRTLQEARSEEAVLAAWSASKEVGKPLKAGVADLVSLRNRCVQALGYDNFFQYQVSDFGMSTEAMLALTEQLVMELRPLYRELHTWARYELARKYQKEVPDLIPAHWLPNRWGQSWIDMVQVQGLDLDAALKEKGPEWLVKQAERFYISLGFAALPNSFYAKSSLYPLPPGTPYKKNNHASAWHMDLEQDVRSLMSVEPNTQWYETTHHELGHIYYYLSYSHPGCPPLLREGANRAFHEAVGSLLGFASMQQAFLEELQLIPAGANVDQIQRLLKEALDSVVFIPFSAGTMTRFEHALYAENLPVDQYNRKWWELVARYQGIAPPSPRGEEYCDACTKTHINDDPAQYYDYALSYVILHQLHAHIARNILKQDPRNTNYYGREDAGRFLAQILRLGATKDWREVMQEFLGEPISARAMLEYFQPLSDWLKEQNQGRQPTLPD